LDNYYKILHPKDKFYYDIYFKNEINYDSYYEINFHNTNNDNINSFISDYLKGFNWVVNYYHNTNPKYKDIDLTWYFKYNRSPLLKDIINHKNTKLLNIKMTNTFSINNKDKYYMTPLEHYLFVSPINNNGNDKELQEQIIKALGNINIKMIIKFIKEHPKYYYKLNEIHKELRHKRIVDCSGSIFLSKCHLLFMENYISMISFINDFRNIKY
jgi:hypothetical protein